MKKFLFLTLAATLSAPSLAADLGLGQEINKSCALCHGAFGQGTPHKLSPRIAGLPKEYIVKAITEYRDDAHRYYPLMTKTANLKELNEHDIDSVAAYIAGLDLKSDARFDIKSLRGDPKLGKELYHDECKTCHGRDGYGKPKKGAPPLAGQYPAYLYTTMRNFSDKARVHDDDEDDDSFTEYSDQEMFAITAYLATLDDKKVVEGYTFELPVFKPSATKSGIEQAGSLEITNISQTVVKMALEDGVSVEDAIAAMSSKAVEINLKLVGEQYVSKELEARGEETPYLSIHQFCNPMDAKMMVMANPIFASYMPCRVSMVEDQKGKMWLMMLNLDMLINNDLLPPNVVETAVRINQQMLDVMAAGASGDF